MNHHGRDDSDKPSPENASHNLGYSEEQAEDCAATPPQRSVLDADFAAEAHGFTGFEVAGVGSTYDQRDHKREDEAMEPDAIGPLGERLLCAGDRLGLRLWENKTARDKEERRRPYEIAGYVVEGDIQLIIEGESRMVHAGESFLIPAGTRHTFRITDGATVLEATSPPARDELD